MSSDGSDPSTDDIEGRIEQVGRYSRFLKIGLTIIIAAFLLSLVGLLPDNPIRCRAPSTLSFSR